MKVLNALFLLVAVGAYGANQTVVSVKSSLQKLFEDCSHGVDGYEDYALCPGVTKFSLADFSKKAVAKFLRNSQRLNPKKATPEEGVSTIVESMDGHLISLLENQDPDDENFRQAIASYKKSMRNIRVALQKAVKNAEVFVDPDTYWAPSVNARALILIREKEKTVTVIMHGDQDG